MFLVLLSILFFFSSTDAAGSTFVINPSMTSDFPHYWEECVGSGHAVLGLREDWRSALKIVNRELGFKQVRFHGLFDDDMSVVFLVDGKIRYEFYNIDNLFDFILSLGMRPLVELSFMPEVLASNTSETTMHYKGITSPPKDWDQWRDFMRAFMNHLIGRYGIEEIAQWNFEVWNEPNCGFFSGTKEDYYQLLKVTSETIHGVNPRLRVGGPATCQAGWIKETMQYIANGTLKLDFISTHVYPTDWQPFDKDIMEKTLRQTRNEVGHDMPVYYTEYNDGLFSNPSYHDTPYASGFIVKTIATCAGYVDALSWWTFCDVFEEQGQNSTLYGNSLGWGLLSLYNIPKPSYRAFELLHKTGNQRVQVVGAHNTVGVLATVNNNKGPVNILVWNHIMINFTIKTETVLLKVKGLTSVSQIRGRRVDKEHANPMAAWESLGSPQYPTRKQLDYIEKASQLVEEKIPFSQESDGILINLTLIPDAIISLDID